MSFKPSIYQIAENGTVNTSSISLLILMLISIPTNGNTESGHINIYIASETPPVVTMLKAPILSLQQISVE